MAEKVNEVLQDSHPANHLAVSEEDMLAEEIITSEPPANSISGPSDRRWLLSHHPMIP